MIAFACPFCGLKLKVKPEYAGRTSKCPTCKKPVSIPASEPTQAFVSPDRIDGSPSSVADAGLGGGVTLAERKPDAGQNSVRDVLARGGADGGRYLLGGEIARGGMGAVLRGVDRDLRREVAVKFMLDDRDPKKKARFIEEAQITGQLAHPNIVPIYELGLDGKKRPFFAMKKVEGRSLSQILDDLRKNPLAEKDWSLARLLNVLTSVCNALAYAHARGVVHRDLKPANIMIGDYGEVYVMDWGLAKVLRGDAGSRAEEPSKPSTKLPAASLVATNRQEDADLTQEGAIMGTPVYMPPEQASGQINAIDPRSDVYSLGAMLYEMLTLQPPIEKEGGYLSVLMRVVEGAVVSPEERVRQGKYRRTVPRELSAVAMKAMAKEPVGRYQNAEELRRDVELFLEGKTVSAKEDSKTEMILKFVKRNPGFSGGAAMTLIVLLVSLWFIGSALLATEKAYADYKREQNKRLQQLTESLPVLFNSAKLSVLNRRFDEALKQVDLVLAYKDDHAEARLLRAQLLIARKEFGKAEDELKRYLELEPDDSDGKQLADLCGKARAGGDPPLGNFIEVLTRQRAYTLAEQLTSSNRELLELYKKQLDAVWPNQYSLKLGQDGGLFLGINDQPIRSLTPIQGMALKRLHLERTAVTDLAPLRGMPLTDLSLAGCRQVCDLTPLNGMPLTRLELNECRVEDLTPLTGMPLTRLNVTGCRQVQDLTALKGMKLHELHILNTNVRDLSPLSGMPLTILKCTDARVSDLSPLKGMALQILHCRPWGDTRAPDLSPLKGMPLEDYFGPFRGTRDATILRPMSTLTKINNKLAEQFWKEYDAKKKGNE